MIRADINTSCMCTYMYTCMLYVLLVVIGHSYVASDARDACTDTLDSDLLAANASVIIIEEQSK